MRLLHVPIGCQRCIECRKKKAREWNVRLQEEIKHRKHGVFVTLTFSNESIKELYNKVLEDNEGKELKGYELDNAIAKKGVRLFLERWRKKHGKSVKHWLVTELGHKGTQNVHLHGIIWTEHWQDIKDIWGYGFVWDGSKTIGRRVNYVNEKTINYIVKYMHKQDALHKYYKPKVLCSAGIGNKYLERDDARKNKFNKQGETNETYRLSNGHKIALPNYYRQKIYNEEEKEKLWLSKIDKGEIWVMGEKCSVKTIDDQLKYLQLLKYYQMKNKQFGYDSWEIKYDEKKYEEDLRDINLKKRLLVQK